MLKMPGLWITLKTRTFIALSKVIKKFAWADWLGNGWRLGILHGLGNYKVNKVFITILYNVEIKIPVSRL